MAGDRPDASTYSEGLAVGYRYDHLTGTTPAVPVRLRARLHDLRLQAGHRSPGRPDGYAVTVVGGRHRLPRAGTDVVQAYLTFPQGRPASRRPSWRPFAPVDVRAGAPRHGHTGRAHVGLPVVPAGRLDRQPGCLPDRRGGQFSASLPLQATGTVP